MIDVKELHIGNFILDNDGVVAKVVGFCPLEDFARCDDEEGCHILLDLRIDLQKTNTETSTSYKIFTWRKGFMCESKLCNPLPLTDEFLTSLGFKKKDDTFRIENFVLSRYDSTQFRVWNYSNYLGIYSLKYVHELQNLYFWITNKKLKL